MENKIKITIINGTNHKGSTYHIARSVADKLNGEIKEFFLPKDFDEFCNGCMPCFKDSEKKCPHYEKLKPITEALEWADVIILASPTYVYHASGQMKALLDHYGYMWMAHRPKGIMFKKQGIVVSTAAGAGMNSTMKDMADSLFYWGVARIYKIGFPIQAVDWNGVKESRKKKIEKQEAKIAKTIMKRNGKVKPTFKLKFMFGIMRMVQKKYSWNPADETYWKNEGWLDKKRPWKNK